MQFAADVLQTSTNQPSNSEETAAPLVDRLAGAPFALKCDFALYCYAACSLPSCTLCTEPSTTVSGSAMRKWKLIDWTYVAGKMNNLTVAASKSQTSKSSSATQSTAAAPKVSKPTARAAAKKATSYVDLVDR